MALKRPLVAYAGVVSELVDGDFPRPIDIAVAAGSATPNPGLPGVQAWSSVAGAMLVWDGSQWAASGGGEGITSGAIADGDDTPDPGGPAIRWSTTLNRYVYWDGVRWRAWVAANSGTSPPPNPFVGQVFFDTSIPAEETGPAMTYTSGRLARIDYDSGNHKVFSYDGGGVLTRVDYVIGSLTVRKDFSYNGDGTLSSITQTTL